MNKQIILMTTPMSLKEIKYWNGRKTVYLSYFPVNGHLALQRKWGLCKTGSNINKTKLSHPLAYLVSNFLPYSTESSLEKFLSLIQLSFIGSSFNLTLRFLPTFPQSINQSITKPFKMCQAPGPRVIQISSRVTDPQGQELDSLQGEASMQGSYYNMA